MHDPMVVAWELRRPWPKFSRLKAPVNRSFRLPFVRWGRWEAYFPAWVTVWHVEPKGHDSGTVCKHWDRWQDDDGTWHSKHRSAWRWHVHHWRIQVGPLQQLRARLFDRCEECGRKGRPNHSFQWEGDRLGWWKCRSRKGLYHRECADLRGRRQTCVEHEAIHLRTLQAVAEAYGVPVREVPRLLFPGTEGYSSQREGPGDFNLRYRLDKLLTQAKAVV